MAVFTNTKMCDECPFRQTAAPGWLGPLTIDEIENMVQYDGELVCHKDIANKLDQGFTEDEVGEVGIHCVGLLRYMNEHCKLSRNREKSDFQNKLRNVKDQPVIPARKFREHHEQDLIQFIESKRK